MYTLYSKRKKDAEGNPEVFIYDTFPVGFRNQFFTIINQVFIEYKWRKGKSDELCEGICKTFAQEKGLKCISGSRYDESNSIDALETYIDKCTDEDFLDLMDFIFAVFISNKELHKYFYFSSDSENFFLAAINELNWRLKQNSLGYEFINGEIVVKTNTVVHENIVKPALKLLVDEDFRGAEEEYLLAFEDYRKGENKNAILNATKAFESTMKTICFQLGYNYNKDRDTAHTLIKILADNSFYPSYLNDHMAGICNTLKSGAPTVRNKTAGHGQGTSVQQISDEYVEYVMNLVATNMLFLYKLYRKKKAEAVT